MYADRLSQPTGIHGCNLCVGLGDGAATEWWERHVRLICGRPVLRQRSVGEVIGRQV